MFWSKSYFSNLPKLSSCLGASSWTGRVRWTDREIGFCGIGRIPVDFQPFQVEHHDRLGRKTEIRIFRNKSVFGFLQNLSVLSLDWRNLKMLVNTLSVGWCTYWVLVCQKGQSENTSKTFMLREWLKVLKFVFGSRDQRIAFTYAERLTSLNTKSNP